MIKKLSLKNIMFAVIAIAMFVCGISTLASFADIKPANVNVEKQIETKVSAEGNEARIGETYYATLEEAFDAVNTSTSSQTCTIYVLASEISIDKTLRVTDESNDHNSQYHSVTLQCDGTNVSITRNFDGELFVIGHRHTLTIGASADDQYQFTMNGNNKAYSMFGVAWGDLVIYSGTYLGDLNGPATIGPEQSGFCSLSSDGDGSCVIYGGTYKYFKATRGGIACDFTADSGNVFNIINATFIQNTAVIGGAFLCGMGVLVANSTIKNNIATGGEGDGYNYPAGIGNDLLIAHQNYYASTIFMNSDIGDVSLGYIDSQDDSISIVQSTIKNIDFVKIEDANIMPTGTIKILSDFNLIGAIKFDGIDGQNVVVEPCTNENILMTMEYLGIEYNSFTELTNTYKIDGSAENFASYYHDTGKALVTYADGITVDASDFVCTNGSVITNAQVEGGSATSLYLTAPTESTPNTGFVDEQLMPMIEIALISMLIVAYVAKVGNKRKSM